MATEMERRLEALENLLLVGGGAALGRLGPSAVIRGGAGLAMAHPGATLAALIIGGYIRRDEVAAVGRQVSRQFEGTEPSGFREGLLGKEGLALPKVFKRKISKANRAVKQGMKFLKSGTKALTGSSPGVLPLGAFRTATVAAGMANPGTPSIIGKGSSVVKKLARKIKGWW